MQRVPSFLAIYSGLKNKRAIVRKTKNTEGEISIEPCSINLNYYFSAHKYGRICLLWQRSIVSSHKGTYQRVGRRASSYFDHT
jgi:hypothetical protein